jgi:hypothetical protein
MVEKKNSTRGNSREGGQTDEQTESRRKNRAAARPPRSEREPKPVENVVDNGVSTPIAGDPTSPPEEIEVPGRLTKRQIAAIQYDYRNGFTVDQILLVTGHARATVYKYIKGIEQLVPASSDNIDPANVTTPTQSPPQSTLSQPPPRSSANPPKVVDLSDSSEWSDRHTEETRSNHEPDGDGYGTLGSYTRENRRPPLPATDSETITELLMLFGRDMRRRGYTNFVDYFERHVIPMFERAEFWMENIPGNSPDEKDHTFRRYLWLVRKFLTVQKEYGDYEAMNNGVKPQES